MTLFLIIGFKLISRAFMFYSLSFVLALKFCARILTALTTEFEKVRHGSLSGLTRSLTFK
jgi:hypothetical protein